MGRGGGDGGFRRLRSVEPEMLKPRSPEAGGRRRRRRRAEEKKEKEKKKEETKEEVASAGSFQLLPTAQVALVRSNPQRKQHATVLINTRELRGRW